MPISVTQEEEMWKSGVLGDSEPNQLHDTLLFLLGNNLALRGGDEHKRLRRPPHDSQLSVHVNEHGRKYLLYNEDAQAKTHQGGLKSKKVTPRQLKVYGSPDPAQNVTHIFEKLSLSLAKELKEAKFVYVPSLQTSSDNHHLVF